MRLINTNPARSGLGATVLSNNFSWQGRTDSEDGEAGRRWHQMVNQGRHSQFALLGFNCDLGVAANKGRIGARAGADAIRSALANLPWHLSGSFTDTGNIIAADDLAQAQTAYAEQISAQLGNNKLVIGLGGGHEIAWGSYQGLKQATAAHKNIGIINFDAHLDLRKPAPHNSSGTPFRQIAEFCQAYNHKFHYSCIGVSKAANTPALFDFAASTNTGILLDKDCNFNNAKNCLVPMLQRIDELYLTICLDAFPAATAPGVSAPSALGIQAELVIDLLHWLAQCRSEYGFAWRLADIAEMNPKYDIDSRTAKLAARIVFEIAEALAQSN